MNFMFNASSSPTVAQRSLPIIDMSTDNNNSVDTKIFIVEVGFSDEHECRFTLEPLATENQCTYEQQFGLQMIPITMPKSFVNDHYQQRTRAVSQSITNDDGSVRLGIGNGDIQVLLGAIEQEVADIIAICSENETLLKIVSTAAGVATPQESQGQWFETPPGSLKCQKLVYYTVGSDARNICLTIFVKIWLTNAYDNNYQSIAFGVENPAFASPMIALVKQSLERHRKPLSVLFIVSSRDRPVYNEFLSCLADIPANRATNSSIATLQYLDIVDASVSPNDDILVAKITLKSPSSNQSDLEKCREKMETICANSLRKFSIEKQFDLRKWTQSAIKSSFEFCLRNNVLPKMNIEAGIVELKGSPADVEDCKNYFIEINTKELDGAIKFARAQYIVWLSYHPETNLWAEYPIKLNVAIEDAFDKGLTEISDEFININFQEMRGREKDRSFSIRRKSINPVLPIIWDIDYDNNRKRIPLMFTSRERLQVLKQFDDVNMKGKYTQIIKIERIQNERWFLQYAAHRNEFKERFKENPYEQSLFHGCKSESVDAIINQNFNRAYAGVNGIVYGKGCYFSSSSQYSHNYAKPNNVGERHMFLVKVLTGKSAIGNSSMVVPPNGFDTTTDGNHIFVTYHDAQAYAEYLITYK